MKSQQFRTFNEFWPHYVREHAKKRTRTLHFVGLTAAMASAAGGVLLRKRALLALAPVAGYGLAWLGHFFVEKNRPASFDHPVWSFRADLVMWSKIVAGTMDAEVERILSSNGYHHDTKAGVDAVRVEMAKEESAKRERQSMN